MSDPSLKAAPDLAHGIPSARLEEGVPLLGRFEDRPVVVVRCQGVPRAVSAICPHQGAPLEQGQVTGCRLRCPWHHAVFDLESGEVERGPALDGLTVYRVIERDGVVRVEGLAPPRPAPSAPPRGKGAPPERVCIVGAGAAGFSAAAALRQFGYDGEITMLDEQASEPVDRPSLSKEFLAGRLTAGQLALRDAEAFARLRIERHQGVVRRIDPVARTVGLGSGVTLSWDRLLLAPGSRAIRLAIPSGALPHVRTLRTVEDAEAIVALAAEGGPVAVVGSSFIGMETAAALRARGVEVTIISTDAVPFASWLGAELGGLIKSRFEARGVRFLAGRRPYEITPRDVQLDDGMRVPARMVVVGIGARPRLELAQRSGIPTGEGILVDAFLETQRPGIYAAGDVAERPAEAGSGRERTEHWVMAQRQGRTVAANILGAGERFTAVPFFWSNFLEMGCDLTFVGRAPAREPTTELVRSGEGATLLYREAGRLCGVATVGDDAASLPAELALEGAGEGALRAVLGI